MKEYIEKQQAIDAAREDGKKIPTLAIRIMHDIKAIPAADVVPVVRCKDCKHYSKHKEDYMCGLNVLAYVCETDFAVGQKGERTLNGQSRNQKKYKW